MKRLQLLRTGGLLAALLLTLAAAGATWWRNKQEAGAPAGANAAPLPPPSEPAAAAGDAPPAAPAVAADAPVRDLFAAVDWDTPPPPPPAPPPAPAPPMAPALPFQFVGRTELADGQGRVVVHLRRGNELFSAQAGQRIDEQYLLESVRLEAIEITYLPMQLRQTLQVGNR